MLVIEVSNKLGKKILMSGGGRCNFTNLEISADNFICNNPHFVKSALSQYTQWDFIAMVARHGINYHEKDSGQLFCDNSAKQILQMLVDECRQAQVDMLLDCEVSSVSGQSPFQISSSRGTFNATSLVIATGGLSIPTLGGATGLGYRLAEQFGLQLNQTEASLVPLTLTGKWHELSQALTGVSLPVIVSVQTREFAGNLLFTHRGLSGPAILQLSNYWHLGQVISINLLPAIDAVAALLKAKKTKPNSSASSLLAKYLPKSLIQALLYHGGRPSPPQERSLHNYKDQELQEIGDWINHWQLLPSGTEGYRTAEVTRGGVDVDAISSKTMQVMGCEGLYFIGEVLDVTGHLGGFNFQWAWSSGYVAGINL